MERLRVQRKRNLETDHEPARVNSELVRHAISGQGRPLEAETRAALEPRFGHSFEHIRVFADERAAESASALGANAYAVGSNIVFGEGRFEPESSDGQRLLAHELAHTVQQGAHTAPASLPDALEVSQPGDAGEAEAEAASSRVSAGDQAQVHGGLGLGVQRSIFTGDDLKDDFWGTKQLLGNKWGGVADAGISTAWDLGGFIPGIGTGVGLAGAGIDGLKSLASSGMGAYHASQGNLDAADKDMAGSTRFAKDIAVDAASAIPIWGQGQGAVSALWDGASTIDRATGGTPAPLAGDIFAEEIWK